jgi:FtsH-binding integral membrane protein
MSFFKPAAQTTSSKFIGRFHMLIWTFIYAGLLSLVLGLYVQRTDDPLGWSMMLVGASMATFGCVLIYVRSRIGTSDERKPQ